MLMSKARKAIISCLILLWTLIFHYEATRFLYLEPATETSLPKFPFLFPASGWSMYYKVADQWSAVRIYGLKDEQKIEIAPNQVLQTHFPGFDPVRRHTLMKALSEGASGSFCHYLAQKFPVYEHFVVAHIGFKHLTPFKSEEEPFPGSYVC